MARRVRTVWRKSEHVVAGLAAVAVSACGSSTTTHLTGETASPGPSETTTPSPTTAPPTPSEPAETPSTRPSSPATTPDPTPTDTPSPAPTPTSSATPHATVVIGRPLRLRRRLLAPGIRRGDDAPLHPDRERLAAMPPEIRGELARLWLGAARMEHASVPAFADIALLLAAVGAPLDLVVAAHRAALDEVEHTRLSYALANAYGETAHAPGPLRRLLGRRVGSRWRGTRGALRRLAVESLRDGCLMEGYAAGLAAAGARSATDPAARAAQERIARDEATHAELSWRLLGWCLDAAGPSLRPAVERALRTLPASAPAPTQSTHLGAHGWPDPATAAAEFAAVRAEVVARCGILTARTTGPRVSPTPRVLVRRGAGEASGWRSGRVA